MMAAQAPNNPSRKRRRNRPASDRTHRTPVDATAATTPPALLDRRKWGYALLVVALLLGIAFRATTAVGKASLHHDETIAYLAATGHQGEYANIIARQTAPVGQWVEASQWKRFVRVEKPLCFTTIGADLSKHDIHPPLYFWLLHLWVACFGTEVWSGPTLNILLGLLSTVLLFGLTRDLLGRSTQAAIVALLWNISAGVLAAAFFARPYELLGCCTVLFVWCLVRCLDRSRPCGWKPLSCLALSGAAGLLTHYHFAILLTGGALLALLALVRSQRRRLASIAAAMAASVLGLAVLHPGFSRSFELAQHQAQPAGSEPLSARGERVLSSYAGFFVGRDTLDIRGGFALEWTIISILAVFVLWAVARALLLYSRRVDTSGTCGQRSGPAYAMYFLIWTAGVNIALYLSFVSPQHAMAPRYLVMVWPFFALLPVLLLQTVPRFRNVLTVFLVAAMLVGGAARVRQAFRQGAAQIDPAPLLADARQLLVDDVRRGWLPRVVWKCPDDVQVYAAPRTYVEQHSDEWLPRLGSAWLYVNPGPESVHQRPWPVLNLIGKRFPIEELEGWFWNLGRAYYLRTD